MNGESLMPFKKCPRCGAQIPESADTCARCDRPVTLDLTARVRKKRATRKWPAVVRDFVLLVGGVGGIIAASVSDNWWIAGVTVGAALVVRIIAQFW
jgi:predicted nucleic acid-binding Zn ribbon protein